MKPPPFAYARPSSLEEALALLADEGDEAKVIAGGQSLVPMLAYRLVRPRLLVDIADVPGLAGSDREHGHRVLGALVRHVDLERAAELEGAHALLREAAGHVGHLPIRVRGTLGGSLAHADPAAELPVAALALDAVVIARSPRGERRIPASEFFLGPFTTALAPDEILTSVLLPEPPAEARVAFEEFAVRAGDFALASAAVGIAPPADGRPTWARVVLGAVAAVPVRARAAESLLAEGGRSDAEHAAVAEAAAAEADPPDDHHASADYRRELVAALVERALRRLRSGVAT
jgi:CO/xanthine dehydrogenase FAD-binding subunit